MVSGTRCPYVSVCGYEVVIGPFGAAAQKGLGWLFANKLDHCPTLFHHVLTVSIAIAFFCGVTE